MFSGHPPAFIIKSPHTMTILTLERHTKKSRTYLATGIFWTPGRKYAITFEVINISIWNFFVINSNPFSTEINHRCVGIFCYSYKKKLLEKK